MPVRPAKPLRRVALDLRDGEDTGEVRANLSVVGQSGRCLWVASDEGVSLERLTTDDFERFRAHRRYPLSQFFDLPAGEDGEADVEGLHVDGDWLWITGSHSLKRKRPRPDDGPEETLERLGRIETEPNRYLLGRIPLVQSSEHDVFEPKRVTADGRAAGCLAFTGSGNGLTKALAKDPVLAPFLATPAKENGFDVEGLAGHGDRLYLGLRGPVLRGWAVILELRVKTAADGRLKLRRLIDTDGVERRYRKHFVNLGGLGIRELAPAPGGTDLLILAGPTMDLDGPVMLWRWPGALAEEIPDGGAGIVPQSDLRRELALPYGHDTDHAEGLCLFTRPDEAAPALLVVYDSPAAERLHPDTGGIDADLFAMPD